MLPNLDGSKQIGMKSSMGGGGEGGRKWAGCRPALDLSSWCSEATPSKTEETSLYFILLSSWYMKHLFPFIPLGDGPKGGGDASAIPTPQLLHKGAAPGRPALPPSTAANNHPLARRVPTVSPSLAFTMLCRDNPSTESGCGSARVTVDFYLFICTILLCFFAQWGPQSSLRTSAAG